MTRDMQKAEVFRQIYLLVCTSMFCLQASKVPKPPSRVYEIEAASTIEKNRVRDHLTQLHTHMLMGPDGFIES